MCLVDDISRYLFNWPITAEYVAAQYSYESNRLKSPNCDVHFSALKGLAMHYCLIQITTTANGFKRKYFKTELWAVIPAGVK